MCMADAEMGHRIPYSFLNDVRERFQHSFSQPAQSAGELGLNDEFARVLKSRMEYFSYDPNADKINRVKGEIGTVKTVMMDNIERVIRRGESIEVLVDKTEQLETSSQSFKVKSTSLKRKMYCKNIKMTFILVGVIALAVFAILMIILWQTGVFDRKKGGGGTTAPSSSTSSSSNQTPIVGTTTAPPVMNPTTTSADASPPTTVPPGDPTTTPVM